MIKKKDVKLRRFQEIVLLDDMDVCTRLTKKIEFSSEMRGDPSYGAIPQFIELCQRSRLERKKTREERQERRRKETRGTRGVQGRKTNGQQMAYMVMS